MVFESTSSFSGSQVPQTQRFIPRSGKSVITVGWENDVADEMRVTMETFLRNAVVIGVVAREFPYD